MRYRRAKTPGGTFFFTIVTFARRPLFDSRGVALLRQALRDVRRRHPFELDAVVVLPDHLHALWTLPPGDSDFSTRWMLVKSAFSRRYTQTTELRAPGPSRVRRREQAIWQRRFWEHQIRDERDLASHVDYIHYNPVKHGYVSAAKDWPYSSFHRYVRLGLCPLDWGAPAPPSFPEGVGME